VAAPSPYPNNPYSFSRNGQLFIVPIGPAIAEVPYPVQSLAKPRDYSLWVRGQIEEPAFKLDRVRMPPGLYQDVRDDLARYAPIPVSRSAFRRSQHAYVGVIDSDGKPYYFALDSRGLAVSEADTNDERVWKTFDALADQEQIMAVRKRRVDAAGEMVQVDRELSQPTLFVIKADLTSDQVARLYASEMRRVGAELAEQTGEEDLDPPREDDVEKARHINTDGLLHLRYKHKTPREHVHHERTFRGARFGGGKHRASAPSRTRRPRVASFKPRRGRRGSEAKEKDPKTDKAPKAAKAPKATRGPKQARLKIGRKPKVLRLKMGPRGTRAPDEKLNAWRQKYPGGKVGKMQGPLARSIQVLSVDEMFELKKALPKKPKEEKTKKAPSGKASKKQAGAGGKTRYTYPQEKGGGKSKAGQQQPLLVVQHDDSKHADPAELANQLGCSVRTLQRTARRLGADGFGSFMRSHLKRFAAKHRIDPDYWNVLYARLRETEHSPTMGI
jgi:hypothetical protein